MSDHQQEQETRNQCSCVRAFRATSACTHATRASFKTIRCLHLHGGDIKTGTSEDEHWPVDFTGLRVDPLAARAVLDAAVYAAQKHSGQRRAVTGEPYIAHPLRVARRLAAAGVVCTDVLVAAILHDTVEDSDATLDDIERLFGARVAALVDEVTDPPGLDKGTRKWTALQRAVVMSLGARAIKTADKLDNLSDTIENGAKPTQTPQQITGYALWARACWRHMEGAVPALDAQLAKLFDEATVTIAGSQQAVPIVPRGLDDEACAQLLREYIKSC